MQDALAFDREALGARRDELLDAMLAAARRDCGDGLLGPSPSGPSREDASAFLDAALEWLESGAAEPSPGLEVCGALAYASVLESRLPEMACPTGEREALAGALMRFGSAVRSAADRRLARVKELEDVLVAYLDAMHAVSSPMNVVTLGVDMARMRLEAGDTEGLEQALKTIEQGCSRVIALRRTVADETPEWAHSLRRARASDGGPRER